MAVYLHHQSALGQAMVGAVERVDNFAVWGQEMAPYIQNPRLFSLLYWCYIFLCQEYIRTDQAQGFPLSITTLLLMCQKLYFSIAAFSTIT